MESVIASAVGGSMRLLILASVAALMLLNGRAIVSAQTVRQPGQLGSTLEVRQVVPNGEAEQYASGTMPKVTVADVADSHARLANRLWIASMVSAVAGTSFDAASSWGQPERNGLLASSDGRFGARGLSIKAAFAAAVIVPQICLRKHSELKGLFAAGNFAEAAAFTGVAVHNLHVRSANGQ